jgi:hypothetical protein
MAWEAPSFVEIDMNAEIGGYQADDGERYEPSQRGLAASIASAGGAGEPVVEPAIERAEPAAE